GLALSSEVVDYIQQLNRRTLDQLSAKIYFYYERFFELANRLADIRPKLLAAQRTATLRHDDETQAVLLNLLLRNYIHFNLYDQADKLVSKTAFPENAGNSQSARYFYYLGRIKAIQLDYTASHRDLIQAIRKAPKNPKSAGFQQAVHKLAIIVQLLTGEIPERSVFREPFLREALVPYLSITQAVRIGDLGKFQDTLAKYITTFRADKTYTLILRLRHNVIKTGIRMISLAYSKISLKDICLKLQLDSEEDAEYIVGKAIRDGVIDAVIDHEHGFMKSKEIVDIYSTNEPQNAFHNRITFCLNLHNESVKALRFPYSQRKETSLLDTMREEERLIAGELAEADLDDDDMGRPLPNARVILSTANESDVAINAITNSDGRLTAPFRVDVGANSKRQCRLRFEFDEADPTLAVFYPFVEVAFAVQYGDSHLHVPLLISPFGYSTYRGS
ncbi:26S proteasome non-ATPase regulatory subunit, partial [Physocladia obscura]